MTPSTVHVYELSELLSHQSESTIKVLFTTMANAPASKPQIPRAADSIYIPLSLFFDFENEFVDKHSSLTNMMPSIAEFEASAQGLGLKLDDHIIIYDDFDNFCASRAWFMLLAMGFKNVKTLNGGLSAWLEAGYATVNQLAKPNAKSALKLEASENLSFVDAAYIQACLSGGTPIQIIDARSPGRFAGVEPEPRPKMRSGHIPTASNLHYSSLLDKGSFKSQEQLTALFKEKNINLQHEIITTCGSGITACIIAQAAYALGANCIRVYDGSWSEWGASDTLPIEVNK